MKFTINYRLLAGMAKLASTDESRYTLTGVCLDIESSRTRLIATDGRRAGIYAVSDNEIMFSDATVPCQFVIPVPDFRRLGYGKGSDEKLVIEKFNDGCRLKVRFTNEYTGFSQVMDEIPGVFPSVERVVPTTNDRIDSLDLNLAFLAGFVDACRIFDPGYSHSVHVVAHGSGSVVSVFTDERKFYGLIMPLRSDRTYSVPEFAKALAVASTPPAPPANVANAEEVNRVAANGFTPVS